MSGIDSLAPQIGGTVRGKRVLVRSDLNVPLDGARITDDGRIRASVPTITELADAGARVVVMAHLGRPKGAPEDRYSLKPVADRLGAPVAFATDTVGESAQQTVAALADGEVALLENVRFNPGETSKDDAERGAFADQLAALADAFVSDGFGVVHRKQASVYDVALRLPHAMGSLVAKEIDVLRRLTEVTALVEKPKGKAPSNLMIPGRYILQPEVMRILESKETGAGGWTGGPPHDRRRRRHRPSIRRARKPVAARSPSRRRTRIDAGTPRHPGRRPVQSSPMRLNLGETRERRH